MFSFSYYIIFYYHAILPCMAIKCLFICICYTLYTQSWQRICLNFSSLNTIHFLELHLFQACACNFPFGEVCHLIYQGAVVPCSLWCLSAVLKVLLLYATGCSFILSHPRSVQTMFGVKQDKNHTLKDVPWKTRMLNECSPLLFPSNGRNHSWASPDCARLVKELKLLK